MTFPALYGHNYSNHHWTLEPKSPVTCLFCQVVVGDAVARYVHHVL